MTPSFLEVLIYCHVSPTPHPREDAPAVQETIERLEQDGIIEPIGDTGGYSTTKKGNKFMDMVLTTPYPVWADPRQQT